MKSSPALAPPPETVRSEGMVHSSNGITSSGGLTNGPSQRPLVLIGGDVDPRLPGMRRPSWNLWEPITLIRDLERALGADLPKITWLIRADDTIRYMTGSFGSGYTSASAMWNRLQSRDHELGWHFHHWTFRGEVDSFDPDPEWLTDAHQALSRYFPVVASRTGWDYANNQTMQRLESLGVRIDFSALPGHLVWVRMEGEQILVDWRRCPLAPYHPNAADYQAPGGASLRLLEVPIASFQANPGVVVKRILWRALHGESSMMGVAAKTCKMTAPWGELPRRANVLAFYFHPEELTSTGIANFTRNIAHLRERLDPEFVTASELTSRLTGDVGN